MTVADNVSFRLREEGIAEADIEASTREALRFVEMEASLDKFPSDLSGGMRRRVSIARALVDKPAVVFYDSPTAGLDPVTSQTIIQLILRGRDTQGVTSILATHRVQDAFGLARYRFDVKSGRVVPSAPNGATANTDVGPTIVLMIREGAVYFEEPADKLLNSSDDYLKKFLASAV
jgi:phospholipid/cholesterol/gamma-HCH transport system ATP-binding protein